MRLQNHIKFLLDNLKGFDTQRANNLTLFEQRLIENCCKDSLNPFLTDPKPINSVPKFKSSAYSYDWYRIFGDKDERVCQYQFGDVDFKFEQPTFTKSRPITDDNANSVLLPFDTIRHLTFIKDNQKFTEKKDIAIWRGAAYQPHRKLFLKATNGLKQCDIADTAIKTKSIFKSKPASYLSFEKQLANKFIFAIEGNDVASNLKWIMGSNSIPVMPKPKYETWFCESFLIAGQHYIDVDPDFGNIQEVLDYYLSHPKLAAEINDESKEYAASFKDRKRMFKIARVVADRYFEITSGA